MESISINMLGVEVVVDKATFVNQAKMVLPHILTLTNCGMNEEQIMASIWANIIFGKDIISLALLPERDLLRIEDEMFGIVEQTRHWIDLTAEIEKLGKNLKPTSPDDLLDTVKKKIQEINMPVPSRNVATELVETRSKIMFDEDGILIERVTYYFNTGNYQTLYLVKFRGMTEVTDSLGEAKRVVSMIRK